MYYVYVQAMDGTPLMPTKRYGKVRRLLKSKRAVPVTTKPFTIRLTYEPETSIVQGVTLGIDPGRTNIGLAAVDDKGRCPYSAKCETRNKEIPKLMEKRKMHRQASRRGERLARKRLAKRFGTTRKAILERILPGYEKPVIVKDIINTESRFNNRRRPEGWLTPTATQLLRTHLNLVRLVRRILPVSRVALEINKFDFAKMENPKIMKWEYQCGPLHGYDGVHHAVHSIQEGKCLLCGEEIEIYHHIIQKKDNGSETIRNIAGLCKECHKKVLQNTDANDRLQELQEGLCKKYNALSVLNQIIPFLDDELWKMFGEKAFATDGMETKKFRDEHGIEKDHDTDAYCIACATLDEVVPDVPGTMYSIKQFRRQNRAVINAQTERTYYLEGKKVATNRRKRADQKTDSLEDYLKWQKELYGEEITQKICSMLTVKKSRRRYNDLKRLLPGAVFVYEGERHVMRGQQGRGRYLIACDSDDCFHATKVTVIAKNTGLVYM